MSATVSAVAACVICVSFAAIAIVNEYRNYRRDQEINKVKKELEDEIRNGGNLSRIADLRRRLQELY